MRPSYWRFAEEIRTYMDNLLADNFLSCRHRDDCYQYEWRKGHRYRIKQANCILAGVLGCCSVDTSNSYNYERVVKRPHKEALVDVYSSRLININNRLMAFACYRFKHALRSIMALNPAGFALFFAAHPDNTVALNACEP